MNIVYKTMMCLNIISWSCTTLGYEAVLEYGYDSNPHKVSSSSQADHFSAFKLTHEGQRSLGKRRGMNYNVKMQGRIYDTMESANHFRLGARLRWYRRYKIGTRSGNLLFTGDWLSERKSYYSQTQRQLAETSTGESLEQRFDYDSAKLSGEFIYRLDRQSSLSLHAYYSERNYLEDYNNLGVESLDYSEISIQPSIRHKSKSGMYVKVFAYEKNRNYEELMNDSLGGKNLNGDTVDYAMQGYGVLVRYPFTDDFQLTCYMSAYQARDDAQGYRDMDYQKMEIRGRYRFQSGALLSWVSSRYSKDYLEDSASPPESETGNSGRLREGLFSEITYTERFETRYLAGLDWHLRFTDHRENNSDDYLNYKRHELAVGLKYSF